MLKTGNMEGLNENREIFKNPDNFIFGDTFYDVCNLCTSATNIINFRTYIRENIRYKT